MGADKLLVRRQMSGGVSAPMSGPINTGVSALFPSAVSGRMRGWLSGGPGGHVRVRVRPLPR